MGIFFRHSRAANTAVGGPIRPKFELVRAVMHVIITCKYEKDQKKNSPENVETPFFSSPELKAYRILMVRRSSVVVNNFKHLLLQNRSPDQSQFLCGASLGRGNESLFVASGSHDQDGRHAHI